MSTLYFKRSSNAAWEPYRDDYTDDALMLSDKVWLKLNGYWYDINGVLSPAGSVDSTQTNMMGMSVGLLLAVTYP